MSELTIHDSGEGPALLLLHAYPLDASMWDAQVAALSGRYRCLRPDFWGCGTSPPPPGEVTIDGYAGSLLGQLDERGVSDFAVCGSSMGGYTSFALLRMASSRVRAVALVGTRSAADEDDARAARMDVAEQVRSRGVEAVVEPMTERLLCERCRTEVHIADPVRGRIRRCSPAGVLAALHAIAARSDSTALLGDIRVPTLVVCGTADGIVPLEESRAMAGAIPHAQLHEFEGSAHLPSLEQPMAFSALLGKFLDAATSGA
ncbi:MAG: alpha/beta hydrolase [Candidatus Dormibacteraeota bacterium]|nr:alpha/beta hydrolase [Candidatus Dormibacteraeota bacterium]